MFLVEYRVMLLAALTLAFQTNTVEHLKVETLSTVTQAVAGQPFTLGVRFEMEPEWHIYWKNPGDSGMKTDVKFNLPKGWKISGPHYPYPERIETANVVSFGYNGTTTLLFTVTPPAGATSTELNANANWLICKDQCLQGGTSLNWKVNIGDSVVPGDLDVQTVAAEFPKADPKVVGSVTAVGKKFNIRITGAMATDIRGAFFYPSADGVLDHAVAQNWNQRDGVITSQLVKSPYAESKPKRISGVLVLGPNQHWANGARALAIDLPVK